MAKKPKASPDAEAGLTHALQVRMSPDLFALLKRAASADDRSVSQWLRNRMERLATEELAGGRQRGVSKERQR
jgi:hypothetical protein